MPRLGHRPSRAFIVGLVEAVGVALIGAGAYVAHPAAGLVAWGVGLVGLAVAAELER